MSLEMSSTTSIEDGDDSGSETSILKRQKQHQQQRQGETSRDMQKENGEAEEGKAEKGKAGREGKAERNREGQKNFRDTPNEA